MTDARFELDRYLDRIGLAAAPRADLAGLVAVHSAQLRAVPFENLDILLCGGVDIDPSAVFDKLVSRRRGGYCFECNGLLCDALRAIGFDAELRLGRVVLDRADGPVPGRTHAIVEVRIAGDAYIADAGFGGPTPRGPVPLREGGTRDDDAGQGAWRLRRAPAFGWRMSRIEPGRPPRDLYVFDQTTVHPADVAVGNHWTSTHPSCHFTQRLMAVRHTADGRIALSGRRFIEHAGDETREDALDGPDALRIAITGRLDIPIDLTADEAQRLWAMDAPGGA